MTYKIGDKKISASELAQWSTADSLHDYKYIRFWIDQIQRARSNAYRCLELYSKVDPPGDTDFINALKDELAEIGVEIVSESD